MELCKHSRVSLVVLTQVCQVEIDVPYTEYQAAQPVVKSIMWPARQSWTCGSAMLQSVFRRLSMRVWAESCDGIVFRSAWRRESEKQPDAHQSRMRVLLAC